MDALPRAALRRERPASADWWVPRSCGQISAPSWCHAVLTLLAVFRREIEGTAVDAVAQAGRIRAIGKHMAEMGLAFRAAYFGSPHEPRAIFMLIDSTPIQ